MDNTEKSFGTSKNRVHPREYKPIYSFSSLQRWGLAHVLIWLAKRKHPNLLHHHGVTLMNGQMIERKKIQRVVEDSD